MKRNGEEGKRVRGEMGEESKCDRNGSGQDGMGRKGKYKR